MSDEEKKYSIETVKKVHNHETDGYLEVRQYAEDGYLEISQFNADMDKLCTIAASKEEGLLLAEILHELCYKEDFRRS